MPGFQTTVREGLMLTVGQAARVELTLNLGALSTEVQVIAETPLLNTESATLERGHHQRADRRSAAQRPRLSRAGAPDVGRGAAAADRQHAARSPRGRQRQRHRRRRRLADPVPPRWRGHHRRASGRHLDSDVGRRAAGVQRSAERVLGRIPRRRRHVQRDDQVGRQRVSRQRVRVHAQRRVRLEELLRREQGEARAQSVRRHARRPGDDSRACTTGETRRSSSRATRDTGGSRASSTSASCRRRRSARGFQRPRADLRSADDGDRRRRRDAHAVCEQPDSGRIASRRRRSSSCSTSRCRTRPATRTCRTRSREFNAEPDDAAARSGDQLAAPVLRALQQARERGRPAGSAWTTLGSTRLEGPAFNLAHVADVEFRIVAGSRSSIQPHVRRVPLDGVLPGPGRRPRAAAGGRQRPRRHSGSRTSPACRPSPFPATRDFPETPATAGRNGRTAASTSSSTTSPGSKASTS